MNIRSLTRGDGVVIGAAVLLFIASLLDVTGCDGPDAVCESIETNAWGLSLGLGLGTYMLGVIGAALIVVAHLTPQPRKVVGLELGPLGIGFAAAAAWSLLWWTLDAESVGVGLILGLIGALLLAGGAIATPLVPALKPALLPAPRPAAPQPYGAQQPPGGYGYPGAQQQQPSFGGQPPQQPYAGQPPQAQAAPQAPAGDFSPFWFAVPVARPLFAEDGSPTPIAELAPGTWYLAVEQRGPALVAQTQDGRRGVLQDTSGIQRG
ncbi:hypothetical protein ACIQAC_03010 [Streptomyces sp. NPDC088387]|uniref:hypothetical protein n=1 Tax=Streptomyces sp. NPDC088387 TaxID=3365859 RepID=UPI003807A085